MDKIKLLTVIVMLVGIISTISYFKGLVLLNGHLYDIYVKLDPYTWKDKNDNKNSHANILLVKFDPQIEKTPEYWHQVINNLLSYQPKLLIINDLTTPHIPDILQQQLLNNKNIFLLHYITDNNAVENTSSVSPLLPTWYAQYPQSEYGIYRRNKRFLSGNINVYDDLSFEFRVLEKINPLQFQYLMDNDIFDNNQYLINYLPGSNYLPVIKAQRAFSNQLIFELVQDKIVLLGNDIQVHVYTMDVPISTKTTFSLLDFQGYSLATVLNNSVIHEVSQTGILLLLLIQCVWSLYIYQWGYRNIHFTVTFAITLSILLSAWIALHFFLLWLPVVEMLLLQLLLYYVVFQYRLFTEEAILQQALLDVTARTQERVIPASFYQSEEPWSQVITLVNQTLNLNRLIFLERIEGDHRLREVKALNCSIDDIYEMRRDYQRTPYSTAIEENAPIQINTKKRAYLTSTNETEEQFLVALIFAEEVLGFWAFGVEPEYIENNPLFLTLVKDYALQISELLYFRQRFQHISTKTYSLLRYIGLKSEISSQRLLKQSIELLNKRLDSVESIFHGMKTAAILYDLFGRVVQMNHNMEAFTQQRHLSAYDMTALDFIATITGIELQNVRLIMQHIITEQKLFNIPLNIKEDHQHFFILSIKPLQSSIKTDLNMDNINTKHEEITPFQILGILLEISDMTEIKQDLSIKEKMNEHFFFQIRNDMESLLMGIGMLDEELMSSEEKKEIIQMLLEKVHQSSNMIKTMHQYFYQDNKVLSISKYPIEPTHIIYQIIHSDKFTQKDITIDLDNSKLETLVYAEPKIFQDTFTTILNLLIKDAIEGSKIVITYYEQKEFLEIYLYNTGFGMPNKQFQQALSGESENVSQDFIQLKERLQWMKNWEAEVDIRSDIGEGIDCKIRLKKVFM